MLKHLIIKNFTLIDTLYIKFESGFSVITGETGAGKSIILGAVGLLLGQRADSKSIKTGATRCIIEAHFDLSKYDMEAFFNENDIDYDAEDCIIRRELTSNGKSRAFINDMPVQISLLKELGEQLVDIHSQHQNLLLNKEDFQLYVIDVVASDSKIKESYKNIYLQYRDINCQIKELNDNIQKAKDDEDYIRFQLKEIQDQSFEPNEQEELEQKSKTLSHAEDIKQALFNVSESLNGDDQGIVNNIKENLNTIRSISHVFPIADELGNRMESCFIEIKDIADEIDNNLEKIDFNPSSLEDVNNRLNILYSLQHKHHVATIQELLDIANEYNKKLQTIDNSDETMHKLLSKRADLKKSLYDQAAELTKLRTKAAKNVEKEMRERLTPLGIPNIRFEVRIEENKEPNIDGHDKVAFYFSANTNTALQPVSQIASGGEIARVMLSLKAMISGVVKLPTIIFDEIDTGVSGSIAEKMARIMLEMGQKGRQVISITHLPQIAALGNAHYKVFKEETSNGTTSRMVRLNTEQRINEIAQMLSGSQLTDAAINNAKELLNKI